MEEAIFDITFMPGYSEKAPPVYRGAKAPPDPSQVTNLSGVLYTHVIESAALKDSRSITVYVPPGIARGGPQRVIYLADGGALSFIKIAEKMILDGRIPPVVIVGIQAAKGIASRCSGECDLRSLEYFSDLENASAGETRFQKHSRFVIDEVIPFVESRYPVAREPAFRYVAGYSSGGVWSLSMAAMRPDIFGNLVSFSIAGRYRELAGKIKRGRDFFGAGEFEGGRKTSTLTAADAAACAGADVRAEVPVGGHSFPMWNVLWSDALIWLLNPHEGTDGSNRAARFSGAPRLNAMTLPCQPGGTSRSTGMAEAH